MGEGGQRIENPCEESSLYMDKRKYERGRGIIINQFGVESYKLKEGRREKSKDNEERKRGERKKKKCRGRGPG